MTSFIYEVIGVLQEKGIHFSTEEVARDYIRGSQNPFLHRLFRVPICETVEEAKSVGTKKEELSLELQTDFLAKSPFKNYIEEVVGKKKFENPFD